MEYALNDEGKKVKVRSASRIFLAPLTEPPRSPKESSGRFRSPSSSTRLRRGKSGRNLVRRKVILRVPISPSEPGVDCDEPAREFEVVRKLGTGSYAVVYLVREVLSRPQPSDDGHAATLGRMDFDDVSSGHSSTEYGREYAIKVLSKANLDQEALTAQLFEVSSAYMHVVCAVV